jgi:dATP pyrophosphohydrolase
MQTSFIEPFAISAYIVYKDKYLLIHRCGAYLKGTWQMVSGGIEKNEKAWQAALREIKEETGLIPNRFYTADAVETFYMKALDKIAFVPVFLAFVDEPGEVQLSPTEHDKFLWLSFEEAKEKLIWSEQKRVIQHIHENFVLKKPLDIFLIEEKS